MKQIQQLLALAQTNPDNIQQYISEATLLMADIEASSYASLMFPARLGSKDVILARPAFSGAILMLSILDEKGKKKKEISLWENPSLLVPFLENLNGEVDAYLINKECQRKKLARQEWVKKQLEGKTSASDKR